MKRLTWLLMSCGFLAALAPAAIRASVLAPPADFKTFANQADVIVIGTFVGTAERQWGKGQYPKTLTDLRFDVDSRLKTDLRSDGQPTIIATTDTPDDVDVKRFVPGKQYVIFLTWVEPFQTYSLNYGLAGAYVSEGANMVPLSPNTELVKRHGPLTRAQITSLVRQVTGR